MGPSSTDRNPSNEPTPPIDDAVDARLHLSGRRVARSTERAQGDLDDVLVRSRRRTHLTSAFAATTFSIVVILVALVGVRAGQQDQGVFINPADPPPPTTVAPTTTPTTAPPPVTTAAPAPAEVVGQPTELCGLDAVGELLRSATTEQLVVDRYACVDPWVAARVHSFSGAPRTYLFERVGLRFELRSDDVDGHPDLLRSANVPVDWLYTSMGLALPIGPPPVEPTTTTSVPETVVVDVDAETLPPSEVMLAALRLFIEDIEPTTLQSDVGELLAVYDGVLLEPGTARRMTEEEKTGIAELLGSIGIAVEFVDVTGTEDRPALLFADPTRDAVDGGGEPPLQIADGQWALFLQLQGCLDSIVNDGGHARTCGIGASYIMSPAEDLESGWVATRTTSRPILVLR